MSEVQWRPSNYFPSLYDGFADIDALKDAEDYLGAIMGYNTDTADSSDSLVNNLNILTANADVITEYEKLFSITARNDETLSFRRSRVINRLSLKGPFTIRYLEQKLNELLGEDNWTLTYYEDTYTLLIQSTVGDARWFEEIRATINTIKPANILFTNTPTYYAQLTIEEQIDSLQDRFNYRFGTTWALGSLPFITENVREVEKLAITPSIQPDLLKDIAEFTADTVVTKAIINTNYEIPGTITGSHTNGIATISYLLPVSSGITEVTRIRLYNAGNDVLTDSTVYIPVFDDVTIEHKLTIAEK
jgi:hypothetical protein